MGKTTVWLSVPETFNTSMKSKILLFRRRRGFALIVTLSLMILLTVIAVGLLSLASISLRSTGEGDAMSKARANAKLALMLAIGDLQKAAGPDKAITAPANLLDENSSKPQMTGVWQSWDYDPTSASLDYTSEKRSRFRSWLVSTAEPADGGLMDFGKNPWTGDTIDLVGTGTLGKGAPSESMIKAGKVKLSHNGKLEGSYAWHVSDEGLKARINAYRDPASNTTLAMKRALLAGHRPDASVITAADQTKLVLPSDRDVSGYQKAMESVGKVVTLSQAGLLGNSKIGRFNNDVTPYSLGLLTDVRKGGLKQDLTSLFEGGSATAISLPAAFKNQKLYQSTFGKSGVSDPNWNMLAGYYNVYKSSSMKASVAKPSFYEAPPASVNMTMTQPSSYYPAPVIAKVEILFSVVVRDAHDPWKTNLLKVSPDMKYMMHFLYTPLVTLHNPYNASIQFEKMQVAIRGVPMSFNFLVNGTPQNKDFVPLDKMYVTKNNVGKDFGLLIGNWTSPTATTPSGTITMKPGETVICGPYLDPGASFNNQTTKFSDWENDGTSTGSVSVDSGGSATLSGTPIKASPGFRGNQYGFDVDWLSPGNTGTSTDGNNEILGLKLTDRVKIMSKVLQPQSGITDRFEVNAQITSKGKTQQYGGLAFQYLNSATLSKLFPTAYTFPETGAGVVPADIYSSNTTGLAGQIAKSVAMFSAYARTTSGGVYETNKRSTTAGALNTLRDGRLAGKPLLFHNPARPYMTINLSTEKPSNQSHEINFQPMRGTVDDVFAVGSDKRTPCLVSYHQDAVKSIKSGSYFELPSGPMQTISDFRRSNVLSSPYLPNFVQPIGNSYVSPLMTTDKTIQSGVVGYPLLDHSFLANHALYDSFYFSTIAPQGTDSADQKFEDFMNDVKPLISQNFQPYLPTGATVETAKTALLSSGRPADGAYKLASSYQMVKGAFNVNSTSEQAWKAMLSTLRDSNMLTLWTKSGAVEENPSTGIPIPAMTLHNGGDSKNPPSDVAGKADNAAGNEWNGYRQFSDTEIGELAKQIVKQVRARGPFLSMSEFVNRRIGSDSDMSRCGALQQAIDDSNLNSTSFPSQVPIAAGDLSDSNLYSANYQKSSVVLGNPAAGAPGWLSQGDVLHLLEPAATVRSDTFVIRTCGEATDAGGKVVARAYAEAVVQRIPEYLDAADSPSVNASDAASNASAVNKIFGRRFALTSFRWLNPSEI